MNGSRANLHAAFEHHFAAWNIHIPDEAKLTHRGGTVRQAGWIINFVFGVENGREFLDFSASHRLTNDQVWRIYDDGESILLAALQEFYVTGDPESERQYRENNKRFHEMAQAVQSQGINDG